MTKSLLQKYPPPDQGFKGLVTALLFGLFIATFLLFFQPFEINKGDYDNLEVLFFGIITTFTFIVFQLLLPRVFPSLFAERKWTILHQIIFYFLLLFSIATLNGLFINYTNQLNFSWSNYQYIILRTFVLGSFPICFFVLFNFNRSLRRNLQEAGVLQPLIDQEKVPIAENIVEINTDLKTSTFLLNERAFLFARANGNYVDIYTANAPRAMYRLSLNTLEQQVNNPNIVRCHRSYLVNLNQVLQFTGNAQGLKMALKNTDEVVPASRKYVEFIRKQLQHKS